MLSLSPRAVWVRLHRWLALSLGVLLSMHALLGSVLIVAKPLDRWAHAGLFTVASEGVPAEPLESVRARLVAEFGAASNFTIRPPREVGDSMQARVFGPWNGTVYWDRSGRELGRRASAEGFYNTVYELHRNLLLGETGSSVLAAMALAYLLMLVSGLVLWWPRRWPPALQPRWGRGWQVWVWDLHRTAGAVLGLALAVCVVTGAYMAWPVLGRTVSALAGQSAYKPVPKPAGEDAAGVVPLDRLVLLAQQQFPQAQLGFVHVPGRAGAAVRVRLRLPDDAHPNGLTSVWLDQRSGQVLRALRWDQLDAGSRYVSTLYPLHTGELGGWPLTVVVALLGLALWGLGVTGVLVWARRRWNQRQARRTASSVGRRGARRAQAPTTAPTQAPVGAPAQAPAVGEGR